MTLIPICNSKNGQCYWTTPTWMPVFTTDSFRWFNYIKCMAADICVHNWICICFGSRPHYFEPVCKMVTQSEIVHTAADFPGPDFKEPFQKALATVLRWWLRSWNSVMLSPCANLVCPRYRNHIHLIYFSLQAARSGSPHNALHSLVGIRSV